MPWRRYNELQIPEEDMGTDPETYSITADVLSFRRCPRQYLIYRERKFVPPNATQFYFGTVVHQTLDLAHSHFKGLVEGIEPNTVPTVQEVYRYFRTVENGLFARGVRPFSYGPRGGAGQDALHGNEDYGTLVNTIGRERANAFTRIRFFNEIEGPQLYPRVIDTEARIDADQGSFIITGNVDVIASTDQGGRELWDYKSSKPEDLVETAAAGIDARMQMRIYAHIYHQRTGFAPTRGVIYCMGAIDPKALDQTNTERPENAIIEVQNLDNVEEYQSAIENFSNTVHQIEQARENNQWPAPEGDPGNSTCDACPKRWDCPYIVDLFRRSRYLRRFP